MTPPNFISYSLRCSRNTPLIAKYVLGRGNILMACIVSLNKTHGPDCVFWCITNLILGIYLICWAEIGRPFTWATSAGDIASVRTYHLSDKLFCKVITAPATQSAVFTVFVVRDTDRTYYLTDKQMRDCIVLFALARTTWFIDIEFTIWIMRIMCKYFSVRCSAGMGENFACFEVSFTSTACPSDKSSFRIMLVRSDGGRMAWN